MSYLTSKRVEINGDRYEVALIYLDKLLLVCPDFEPFDLNKIINKFEPDYTKTAEIRELKPEIKDLLLEIHLYAEPTEGMSKMKLNDLGRYVKSIGGHFAYINEQIREQKEATSEKKSERRKNKAAFILSIGAFVLSLIATFGLVPSNKESVPVYDNQKQIDSLFQLIDDLEKRIDNTRLDTLLIETKKGSL